MAQWIITVLEIFGIGGIVNFTIQVFGALIILAATEIRGKCGLPIKTVKGIVDDANEAIYEKCIKYDWYPAWEILKIFLLFPLQIAGTIWLVCVFFKLWKEEDAAK